MELTDDLLLRYSRHILLPEIGVAGQARICDAAVLVVGAGGLGCPAALYLGGAGGGRSMWWSRRRTPPPPGMPPPAPAGRWESRWCRAQRSGFPVSWRFLMPA